MFNICFDAGVIPSDWGNALLTLSVSLVQKIGGTLNDRFGMWSEDNGKIVDEQNGFRKKHSTVDHLSSLTTLLDTKRKCKLSTCCAFIDFKKAYDCINRDILWDRLSRIGVSGKLFGAVKSLYSSVSACVRVNNFTTELFNVNRGVRQGAVCRLCSSTCLSMTLHCK